MKLLEAVRLNSNTYIQIVQIADRILVLAVSKESVNTICELSKEEYEESKVSTEEGLSTSSFSDFLIKAREKVSGKKN